MESSPSPFGTSNPYATPLAAAVMQPAMASSPPTFCTVIFSISLAFSFLRLLVVPLSVLGYYTMQQQDGDNPLGPTVLCEIASGTSVALLGILGNILLLMKKGFGIPVGWLMVAAVVSSIAVGVWQATILSGNYQPGTPQFVGAIIGAAFTTVFRATLLGLYVTALTKFAKWHRQRI